MIPLQETKCNCQHNLREHNTDYGGGRRFERAMECYRDDDCAPGQGASPRRQQRIVTRHNDIAKC